MTKSKGRPKAGPQSPKGRAKKALGRNYKKREPKGWQDFVDDIRDRSMDELQAKGLSRDEITMIIQYRAKQKWQDFLDGEKVLRKRAEEKAERDKEKAMITASELAETTEFQVWCADNNIPPTKRQASKRRDEFMAEMKEKNPKFLQRIFKQKNEKPEPAAEARAMK